MNIRQRLQPIDYAVMFGGPIVFMLIFWLGVRIIVGPIPEPSPVKRLREGEVKIGARLTEVDKLLGRPNEVVEVAGGGFRYIYTRTVYEESTKSDTLDEAVVEFTPEGRVQSIKFDNSPPPRTPD
jgi:hypothetical protein